MKYVCCYDMLQCYYKVIFIYYAINKSAASILFHLRHRLSTCSTHSDHFYNYIGAKCQSKMNTSVRWIPIKNALDITNIPFTR